MVKIGLCWEPRGTWDPALIKTLRDKLDLVRCVDPFANEPLTKGLRYFRLHGRGGYNYRYRDAELAQLAKQAQQPQPTYVLFNNVPMLDDAKRFLEMEERG